MKSYQIRRNRFRHSVNHHFKVLFHAAFHRVEDVEDIGHIARGDFGGVPVVRFYVDLPAVGGNPDDAALRERRYPIDECCVAECKVAAALKSKTGFEIAFKNKGGAGAVDYEVVQVSEDKMVCGLVRRFDAVDAFRDHRFIGAASGCV